MAGGFGGNKNNSFDRLLSYQLDRNNLLKEHLSSILKLIEKGNSLDQVEKEEILNFFEPWIGYGVSGFTKGENSEIQQMKTIFSKLELNESEVKEMLQKMITLCDDENKTIGNYLNQKSTFIGDRENIVSTIKTRYQAEKIRLWGQIRLKLGETAQFEEFEINRSEKTEEDIAKGYVQLYRALEDLVLHKDGKNDMKWDGIYNALQNIEKELSQIKGKYQESFISWVWNDSKEKRNNEAKTFAENYFKAPQTFQNYFTLAKKEIYDKGKIYSELEDNEKKKIDKLLSNALGLLFDGIDDVSRTLKENVDKNDDEFKEAKRAYEEQYKLLVEKVGKDKKYRSRTKLEDAKIFGVDGIDNGISFKEFETEFIKKNKKAETIRMTNYLELLNNEKTAYENFQKNNNTIFDINGNESLGDDLDEVFKEGEKFEGNSSDIKGFIEEAKKNILGPNGIGGISKLLSNLQASSEKENLDKESLKEFKATIIFYLKTIGRNLEKYREVEKTSWNSEDLKNKAESLKKLIRSWNGNIVDKQRLGELLGTTADTIKYI